MKKLMLFFVLCFGAHSIIAQSWIELGGTVPGIALNANYFINSICSDPSGNIYATGRFSDTYYHQYVAKWNGTEWSELGGTVPGVALNANNWINSICSDSLGNIYAGGEFKDSNGNYYVAKWDGAKWTELGGTVAGVALNGSGIINSICTDPFGSIYAGGEFKDSNGNYYVAKWDGTKWIELGGTVSGVALNANNWINSIFSDAQGSIYAAGWFTDINGNYYVAKWDGTKWAELGGTTLGVALNANGIITSICSDPSGNLYVGGNFQDANGETYVAKWDGTKWTELGGIVPGTAFSADLEIFSICSDASGNIYAGGWFQDANSHSYVAKWEGTKWIELGGTVPGVALNANSWINSICSDASGNIYAGGMFQDANFDHYYVAKFGTTNTISGITSVVITSKPLSIYPNPTNGGISLNVSENGTVNIYNPLGVLAVTQTIDIGKSTISLDGFPSGIYTVIFNGTGGDNYPPSKIIKE